MTKFRVRTRVALTKALASLPPSVAQAVHARYWAAPPGRRRTAIEPFVSLLRHRPLTPLQSYELPDNPSVRLAAVESRLGRLLYWYGEAGYERGETYWWRFFCARANHVVELGANIGFYTVQGAMANPDATYVAVEPHPGSAATVRKNVTLNGLENVELVEKAVVGHKTEDTLELHVPDEEQYDAPTGAYLHGAEGVSGRSSTRSVTVEVVEAAELVAEADLIKLDIEGYEYDVLTAASEVIEKTKPVIFVEAIRGASQLRDLITDWHRNLGYLVFAIGEDSLHLLTGAILASDEPLPRFGTRDLILVQASVAGDFLENA